MPENATDKQLIQLAPNKLELFEQVSLRYDALIAQGVKPEDLLVPGFWAHHAVKLRPWHEIRARAEDGTWMAYFVVLDTSRTWAKVQMLALHHLTTADVSISQASETAVKDFKAAHEVKFRGQYKWSIVRRADGAVLAENMLKDEATTVLDKMAREQVGGAAAKPTTAPVAA